MKKVLLLTAIMVLIAGIAYGAPTIVSTPHDLRGTTGGATTEVCVFCHTPHNASTDLPVVMWNHASTGATYTAYSSATLKGDFVDSAQKQPSGVSKACLSCHDGTVAVNQLQGGFLGAPSFVQGAALIGTNLQSHHPVSINYRNDLNASLLPPGTGGTLTTASGKALPLFGTTATLAVECGSCHAVHDNTTAQPFLRDTNGGSQLCLACHAK
jgi:predicted CXXCH cytochrome family protein